MNASRGILSVKQAAAAHLAVGSMLAGFPRLLLQLRLLLLAGFQQLLRNGPVGLPASLLSLGVRMLAHFPPGAAREAIVTQLVLPGWSMPVHTFPQLLQAASGRPASFACLWMQKCMQQRSKSAFCIDLGGEGVGVWGFVTAQHPWRSGCKAAVLDIQPHHISDLLKVEEGG